MLGGIRAPKAAVSQGYGEAILLIIVAGGPPAAQNVFREPNRIYVACATTERKRRMARPKNKAPITATARNCGHTTSIPAPR